MNAPPQHIRFRLATAADTADVCHLLTALMHSHGIAAGNPEEVEATVHWALERPDHAFLLALSSKRVVGMCALLIHLSTWRNALICEIQDVIVLGEERGKGIGTRLLREAETTAADMGCALVYLTAESWNLPAHAFYRSAGFMEKTLLYFERSRDTGRD